MLQRKACERARRASRCQSSPLQLKHPLHYEAQRSERHPSLRVRDPRLPLLPEPKRSVTMAIHRLITEFIRVLRAFPPPRLLLVRILSPNGMASGHRQELQNGGPAAVRQPLCGSDLQPRPQPLQSRVHQFPRRAGLLQSPSRVRITRKSRNPRPH